MNIVVNAEAASVSLAGSTDVVITVISVIVTSALTTIANPFIGMDLALIGSSPRGPNVLSQAS